MEVVDHVKANALKLKLIYAYRQRQIIWQIVNIQVIFDFDFVVCLCLYLRSVFGFVFVKSKKLHAQVAMPDNLSLVCGNSVHP